MAKEKQHETYYNDHINTIRSFIPHDVASHTPVPISPAIKDMLQTLSRYQDLPEPLLLLEQYTMFLVYINIYGYHDEIRRLFDNYINYSQDHRIVNLADPEVQKVILGEDPS